jgi:hypothetical protein
MCTAGAAPTSSRIGSDYQPKPEADEPLYSHCRVCSSVHPGTAKPLVTVGTVTRWAGRKWRSCGLERSTVAASAEAHKVINRPKAKTDRIVFAPFGLPTEPCTSKVSSRGLSWDPTSAGMSAVSVKLIMCADADTARSCSGLTIDQIGGIMGPCPNPPARRSRLERCAPPVFAVF